MSNVFVLDTNKTPLNPVHPGRARLLLKQGKAAVWRRYPFTIMLKEAIAGPQLLPLRLKLDPGSKTTGLALVNDATGHVVWAAELSHRGQAIKKALDARRGVRRGRRRRHTRYRQPRFANRRNQKKGWLPPSLESRLANTLTWVARLMRLCPIADMSMELVKFDMQLLENAEMSGVEYQQGPEGGTPTASTHLSTSEDPDHRCRSRKHHALGTLRADVGHRTSCRMWDRGTHEVQSDQARSPQSPLDGCGLCRSKHARVSLHCRCGATVHYCHGERLSADV